MKSSNLRVWLAGGWAGNKSDVTSVAFFLSSLVGGGPHRRQASPFSEAHASGVVRVSQGHVIPFLFLHLGRVAQHHEFEEVGV